MNQITLNDAVKIANGAIAVGRYDVAVAMCENIISAHPWYNEARRISNIAKDKKALREAKSPLNSYGENKYSQNGEDGIIAEILLRLRISSGNFCEFGAWDGIHLSNTYSLAEAGWSGVYIEGDAEKYKDLVTTCSKLPGQKVLPVLAFVSPDIPGRRVDDILSKTAMPKDFDILSIDIDSCDYQIWASIKEYLPKIVIIEVNSTLPPPVRYIHGEEISGSSFMAIADLAKEKGYTVVCHTGNAICVRSDLVDALELPEELINDPSLAYISIYAPWDNNELLRIGSSL
ncbi:hypothetical protein ABNQ38_06050 (plasmid) [Azospirillum sp. A29]|uniref:hypothetical protein n=1 Tax=Azospirillum sp. A29 TaxID=3160606 RepID=UPI00366B199A